MKRATMSILVAVLLAALPMSASAMPTAMHTATQPLGNRVPVSNAGLEFDVVGTGFRVYELGVYDSEGNGITQGTTLTTVLFDSDTQSAVATMTFTDADGVGAGSYIFKALVGGPIVLDPGRYAIVSYGFNEGNPLYNTNFAPGLPTAIRDPDILFVQSVWGGTAGVYPTSTDPGDVFHGPNMMFSIPAPGAILLTSVGAGLVGYLRRRKTL